MFRFFTTLVLATGLAGAQVPRPAPDYSFNLPDGQTVRLSQYRGKVVVLQFLLTTCPHCALASKTLAVLQREYGTRKLQVLGVAINDGAAAELPAYLKQNDVTFPTGVGSNQSMYTFLRLSFMQRVLMPQVAFIDKDGVIRKQVAGDDPMFQGDEEANLRAAIDPLLKEVTGPPPSKVRRPVKRATK
jgi:peroxiredoxin